MYGYGYQYGKGTGAGGGVPFDTDYDAILAENISIGGTNPSSAVQSQHNAIIVQAKASGAWADTDYFLAFQHDGSESYGTINWKNPTGAKATLNGGYTQRSNIGIKGNGTNAYVLTQFVPNSGTNYALNDAGIGVYCDSDFSNNNMLFGVVDVSARQLYLSNFTTDNNWNYKIGSNTNRVASYQRKTDQHYFLSHDGTNVVLTIASNVYTVAQGASLPRPDNNVTLLSRRESNNAQTQFSKKTIGYFYAGDVSVGAKYKNILDTVYAAIRPANYMADLLADFDMTDTNTLWADSGKTTNAANGGTVLKVSPKTGTWGDLVAASGDEALREDAAINSLSALRFDGITDNYGLPAAIISGYTIFIVARNLDATNGSHLFKGASGANYMPVTGDNYAGNSSYGGSEYFTIHLSNGTVPSGMGLKVKTNGDQFNILVFANTGSNYIQVNGFYVESSGTSAAGHNYDKMGDEHISGWQLDGYVAQAIFYDDRLSDRAIEDKMFELASKFNL